MIRMSRAVVALAACALLGACFPTAVHRNDAPDIWRHVSDARSAGNVSILVLAIAEERRAGNWATLGGVSGVRRQVRAPMFIAERELKGLNAQLSITSVDMAFIGYLGGWVEKSDARISEVCVLWPDGRFLSLGDPAADKWQRETRGLMTKPWLAHLLQTASSAEVFNAMPSPGACPYAWAKLDWDYATRQRVIAYLKQIAIGPAPD